MNQLKVFAIQHSLTQGELAQQLGVTREYLNRIINGQQQLTSSMIGRFAAAFGFAAAETVFGNGSANPQSEKPPCPQQSNC